MQDLMPINVTTADLKAIVGRRLDRQLRSKGRTAQDLATYLGKTARAVHLWISGTNMMPTDCVVQAAGWLGINPWDLLPSIAQLPSGAPPRAT